MPPGMPYYVEKGEYFSVLDAIAEGSVADLLGLRSELLAGTPIRDIAAGLPVPAPPAGDPSFAQHLAHDWFGEADAADKATTGWWMGYRGDVEVIVRETMVRAIDVSLGLDRTNEAPQPADVRRHWPIQFYWVCGSRWFEGWVGWRDWGSDDTVLGGDVEATRVMRRVGRLAGLDAVRLPAAEITLAPGDELVHDDEAALDLSGVVTTFFMTPGMVDKVMYTEPKRPDRQEGVDGYFEEPTSTGDATHGLWCVSAERHERRITAAGLGWKISDAGSFAEITVLKESLHTDHLNVDGGAVVVSPAEQDGGVLPTGRQI